VQWRAGVAVRQVTQVLKRHSAAKAKKVKNEGYVGRGKARTAV